MLSAKQTNVSCGGNCHIAQTDIFYHFLLSSLEYYQNWIKKLEILDVRERKQYLPTPAFGAFVLDH